MPWLPCPPCVPPAPPPLPPQGYESGMAAKLGLQGYDSEVAAGLLALMYEDSGGRTRVGRAGRCWREEGG